MNVSLNLKKINVLSQLVIFILLIVYSIPEQLVVAKFTAAQEPKIQIISPGEGSRVTSPIFVDLHTQCGLDGLIELSLIDKNNFLLTRQVVNQNCVPGVIFEERIPIFFDVNQEGIPARIVVKIEDQFDRPMAISSAKLFLATSQPDITNSMFESSFLITSPSQGSQIKGQELVVTGEARTDNESPIFFEVMAENGGVLGSTQIPVNQNDDQKVIPFSIKINISEINRNQNIRLIIRQRGLDIPGNVFLDSLDFNLAP